jgi:glycosyltransferase involved in cell wall biosynthesis
MKVTIICPFYPGREAPDAAAHYGGVERQLARLAQELAAQGLDVTVLCTARSSHTQEVRGVRVRAVRRLAVVFRNPVAIIVPALLSTDGDVVQVPATYPGFSDLALLSARLGGKPCVLDLHFEPVFEGLLASALTRLYMLTGARLFRRYDRVVVHSPSYAQKCDSVSCIDSDRLVCIPNGVDCNAFQPIRLGTEHPSGDRHTPNVLFVGRLVPYKGIEVLLDAWPRVVRCLAGARLIIVGSGPLEAALRARALRLRADIRFLGFVGDEELRNLYRSSDVTVLPSVNGQEAFGMTLLESMACGTPVVASGLPGVRDIALIGGKTAPPGNPEQLAAAIVQVLQDHSLARGWTLHERVRERFSWPHIAAQYLQLYDSIVRAPAQAKGKS